LGDQENGGGVEAGAGAIEEGVRGDGADALDGLIRSLFRLAGGEVVAVVEAVHHAVAHAGGEAERGDGEQIAVVADDPAAPRNEHVVDGVVGSAIAAAQVRHVVGEAGRRAGGDGAEFYLQKRLYGKLPDGRRVVQALVAALFSNRVAVLARDRGKRLQEVEIAEVVVAVVRGGNLQDRERLQLDRGHDRGDGGRDDGREADAGEGVAQKGALALEEAAPVAEAGLVEEAGRVEAQEHGVTIEQAVARRRRRGRADGGAGLRGGPARGVLRPRAGGAEQTKGQQGQRERAA
jgi:hypothetical protein